MDCFFCKNDILVKESLFFRTGEKLENFNQFQNEHSCMKFSMKFRMKFNGFHDFQREDADINAATYLLDHHKSQ